MACNVLADMSVLGLQAIVSLCSAEWMPSQLEQSASTDVSMGLPGLRADSYMIQRRTDEAVTETGPC